MRQLVVLLFLTVSIAAQAQLEIVIDKGVSDPTPIAVAPVGWNGAPLSEDIGEIIRADLRRSGLFYSIPVADMLSSPARASEVYYRDWRVLRAQYLVVGNLTQLPSGQYNYEYQLFDVYGERPVFPPEGVNGSADQLRDLAHYAADRIYQAVTGIRGVFSTKIAYVEQVGDIFRLMQSDADGARRNDSAQSDDMK